VNVTCDCGATSSLIRHDIAIKIQLPIVPTSHSARQADGKTKLTACGEVHTILTRGSLKFKLDAVVVKDLDVAILGGIPFLKDNNIVLDIPHDQIIIDNKHIIKYNISSHAPDLTILRTQSHLLRSPEKHVIFPGEYVDLLAPSDLKHDIDIAVEPRSDSPWSTWPSPDITRIVAGHIRIPNLSTEPIAVGKHQHIAQVLYVQDPHTLASDVHYCHLSSPAHKSHLPEISIDPDNQLTHSEHDTFITLHNTYSRVFSSQLGKYNDASGTLRASINIGPIEPPSPKGRLPSYSRSNMNELQDKMDELEAAGILAKPEDVGITVEYISPSFLVRKPNGGSRLVTSFINIASYAKPPPSRVVSSDDVLRFLARWTFIIKSDMTSQFFQLPMKKSSMKYLGIITPFKGTRVYTRAAMGMPGSSEHLDELMSRVLGDLIHGGSVMKIADDLYVGGDTIVALLYSWERVLERFDNNNLRLSPNKTVICPKQTTVLGWIWTAGSISISPHKISPLATASKPITVKGMRSWCGAYKHLKACIPQHSTYLADLEEAVAGKDSHEHIVWNESLTSAFTAAQDTLQDPKSITIPKPSDQLIITNDGALRKGGMGSILYILRNGELRLGGYFSAKLKSHQLKWLPCEMEALAITSALNHWGPYILEAHHPTQVLSDSKPCIQAYSKLARGEFSSSARVSTFLSTLSRYRVALQHISGSANLPADFHSRNPMECTSRSCQICAFIADTFDSSQFSINNISILDVTEGRVTMPYTNSFAWKQPQQDCSDLRRTYSHLSQGTRPSKKMTKIKDVKRYLRVASIGRNGILVVKQVMPFAPTRNLIIIPRNILHGMLTALHLRFQHPTKSQLHKLFQRHFFALNVDEAITLVTNTCAQCASLAQLPREVTSFSTSLPISKPGLSFACDVLCRARQKIFVMRDSFSSFTVAKIIPDEQSASLRSAVIETTAELISPDGAIIRVDGAPAFQSLANDASLKHLRIKLEVGRLKNINKNPVAEKAIQELELELKKQIPDGGPTTAAILARTVSILNSRVRNRGLSAKEILFQRDQLTGEQLNFTDAHLAEEQHRLRVQNHEPSAHSKAPKGKPTCAADVSLGDLVYVKEDGNKHSVRDRYIVTACGPDFLTVHKLVGSQFRSREYKLKYSEVFPVPCASIPHLARLPHSNPYDSDSSDNSDSMENQSQSAIVDIPMPPQHPPASVHTPGPSMPPDHPHIPTTSVPSSPTPPRTSRLCNRPGWMLSGDWEY